jgi:hypothetical protein
LDLPLLALRTAWSKYIVAPIQGLIEFDEAVDRFQAIVNELFAGYIGTERAAFAFFPSNLRTPIMEAGADRRLIRLTYDGITRIAEPYSLAYKQRRDGHREEYLYVYDRTGGRSSGPGLKSWLNHKIQSVEVLEEQFDPRYPIELGKAGEAAGRSYFGKSFGGADHRVRRGRLATLRHGWRYSIQCSYCARVFKRMRRDTAMRPHKDGYGNNCPGRRGTVVNQELV